MSALFTAFFLLFFLFVFNADGVVSFCVMFHATPTFVQRGKFRCSITHLAYLHFTYCYVPALICCYKKTMPSAAGRMVCCLVLPVCGVFVLLWRLLRPGPGCVSSLYFVVCSIVAIGNCLLCIHCFCWLAVPWTCPHGDYVFFVTTQG